MSHVSPNLRDLLATPEPPSLGPGPRAGVQAAPVLEARLDDLLSAEPLLPASRGLLRALVLLWHDHLDAAHGIAQENESANGSYVHGLVHRREPDYGNAKYWFRRVGRHACFTPLAVRASTLLPAAPNPALAKKLLPRGVWDPLAFVDSCEEASQQSDHEPFVQVLRAVQQAEFEILLEHLLETKR